ncbi:methyltransferase domain-containing protein [Salmonella enterica]|uniref:Methyltransferase domain-containing protein n=2 Tax=Salmonella enterica TaxID=28901 RepID=A0A619I159_SALER|nr:class I SAM-dependent methyltransferase [Salmonella enterica]EBV8497061.1 class I SAM-dependent methyltransferase [Salmonella enterica subsp. enterica serovar Java]ECJ2363411.1 methyltransferase domain-containing protein [Salmonella enterica subsp. diarizonae]EAT8555809.1 methyltransferase domain-containing protein [Salmonella enterica]EAV0849138.1 class I SAM-dependent methyltransferase [Salmonella enterica]
MNSNRGAILQPYWDLVLANIKSDVLRVAIEWDLFRYLDKPTETAIVAARFRLDPENTGYMLDILWSMGLLSRESGEPVRYATQAVAQNYFCSDAAQYLGDAFLFRLRGIRHFGSRLADQVRSGAIYSQADGAHTTQENWAKAAGLQIGQEQRAVTVDAVMALMKRIPEFQSGGRLLDLGGGPGLIAIAMLQACPAFSGEVFDFPETVKVAQHNIHQAGLGKRLQVRSGDLVVDPIGENFDFIWCSSVLHFVPDINDALEKIWAALKPGGVFVSAHAEVPTTATEAEKVLPYYLSMQMKRNHVTRKGELSLAMATIGFTQIDQYDDIAFPVAPVSVLVARKEAV